MKRNILFVDDEPKVLDAFKRSLRKYQREWDMSFASSADDALVLLAEKNFDAVVTDIKMPAKNGLELLEAIKSSKHTRDVEVIVVTGLDENNLKHKALELGAADLLNKPIQKEDLVARLKNALRLKSYHDDIRAQHEELERQLFLSQKMEVIGLLAAGAIHDLNNILSLMVGSSEILGQQLSDDPKVTKNLDRMRTGGVRAQNLLQQILSFVRKTEEPKGHCNINQVIEECVDLLRPSLGHHIILSWNRPEEDLFIDADSTQLYQLILNLGTNAVQAMKGPETLLMNGGELGITLRTARSADSPPSGDNPVNQAGGVILEVSDTGPGMDEETAQDIFKPMFTTKSEQGGSGLGLSVVKRIVEYLGGKINIKSKLGEGTTFRVYLPGVKTRPRAEQIEEEDVLAVS
jgi:signal transduction histidine kinase